MLGSHQISYFSRKTPRIRCIYYAFIDINNRAHYFIRLMPLIARKALTQRLENSGMLDRLKTDVRILFRKRLWFISPEEALPAEPHIRVPLVVGAVALGHLGFGASARRERNEAYSRWLTMAARIFAEELNAPPAHGVGAVPAKINRAARIIQERYSEPLSLGEVAAEVALSRERLSRLFHQSLGITFSEYLTQARLGHALEMLRHSDRPVTEIAYESGFQSLSQFNRSFAKMEACSPRDFRKSVRAPRSQSRVA